MIIFWLIITLLSLIAVGFLLFPLLRRSNMKFNQASDLNVTLCKEQLQALQQQLATGQIDQRQYEQLKLEQEAALLADMSTERTKRFYGNGILPSAVLAVVMIFAAFSLYLKLGASQALALSLQQNNQAAAPNFTHAKSPQAMITEFKRKVEADPNDAKAWMWLGRLYVVTNDMPQAVFALKQANTIKPNDPDILSQYVQVLFRQEQHKLTSTTKNLLARLLTISPNNPDALIIMAADAYFQGKYQVAINYWERILQQLPEGSDDAKMMLSMIIKAQKKLSTNQTT